MNACIVDDCDRKVRARGLCERHYNRWRVHGDPLKGKGYQQRYQPGQKCLIEGCESAADSLGWCNKHYMKWRQYRDPLGSYARGSKNTYNEITTCKADGCERQMLAKGFCNKHYIAFKKFGDPMISKHRWNPQRREWHLDHNGYVHRYDIALSKETGGRIHHVFQHREVMAAHIGRHLLKGENVHHKNGIRSDNRIENLELWISSQPAGQRVQDLVQWARELLQQYGDLVDRML